MIYFALAARGQCGLSEIKASTHGCISPSIVPLLGLGRMIAFVGYPSISRKMRGGYALLKERRVDAIRAYLWGLCRYPCLCLILRNQGSDRDADSRLYHITLTAKMFHNRVFIGFLAFKRGNNLQFLALDGLNVFPRFAYSDIVRNAGRSPMISLREGARRRP